MQTLDFNLLMGLAMATPFLDEVEQGLHDAGFPGMAGKLCKLQADAGLEMSGINFNEPAPGPETARLLAAYEPVTAARWNSVLRECHAHLPDGEMKSRFAQLAGSLTVPELAAAELSPPKFQ